VVRAAPCLQLAEDKLGKLTGGIMAELEADQQVE
jgi:hypothetical protein